jgi:Ca2+-binding RTX toxin-like protein
LLVATLTRAGNYGPGVRRFLVSVVVATAALGGSAGAGNYSPPPGDGGAQWLSNEVIAFGRGGGAVITVNVDGTSQEHLVASGASWPVVASSTEPLLAFVAYRNGQSWLVVTPADGSNAQPLAEGVPVLWVPDASRLIFHTGSVFADFDSHVYSVHPDGTNLTAYPANVRGIPSPDGSRFAYVTNTNTPRLHIVNADGSADITYKAVSPLSLPPPVWSPDGSQLAFWSNYTATLVVAPIGGRPRNFTIPGSVSNGSIVWAPEGRTIYASGKDGLVGIDLPTGKRHTLPGIPLVSGPTFSPDGKRIAYSAGGECRDRLGIYVANADGSERHRVSNSCRIVGTDGADVLHGSFSQVVLGLGGNDTLYADDTYYYFDGNTLYGGPGDDQLIGGDGTDVLYGGRGDDTLSGGPFRDVLIGGPGRDHIDGGTGNDVTGAHDGERDWITCGTSGPGSGVREKDVVYADKIDIVAPDCEIVHRS